MAQRTKTFVVKGKPKTFYSLGVLPNKPKADALAAQLRKDVAYMGWPVRVTKAVPPSYRARGYYEVWIGARLTAQEAFWHASMGRH